jgi:hypothetical protein
MKQSDRSFRVAFITYAIFLAFAMPLMSFDHGATWDEYRNHRYGQFLLDYYGSLGEVQKALNYSNLYLYGGLFELTAEGAVELINPHFKNNYTYEIRHVFNALTGFLAMLFTGLLGRYLGGWRCGLLALLMISLSPRFLGHSMNNPKDIPFAAFFVMSLYFMVKVLYSFPKPSKWDMLWLIIGIACTINIRVGGLLLICYLGLFLLVVIAYKSYRPWVHSSNPGFLYLKPGIFYGLLIAIPAYFGGVLFWPYGLMNPIIHPVETLFTLSDFPVILGVWFNGEAHLSHKMPWFYYPQSLAITTPIILLAGLLGGLIYWGYSPFKRFNSTAAMLLFTIAFPLLYIIVSGATVYDGIRQVLFVYPPMVVLSSWGLTRVGGLFKKSIPCFAYCFGLGILLALPIAHIAANYPNEYIYYNTLAGGVQGAAGSYDLDYWGNASKQLNHKLGKHLEKQVPADSNVVIVNNFVNPTKYQVERHHGNIEWKNITGGLPEDMTYDYAILIARWFPLKYFDNGKWPPENTLFKEEVSGVPIGVVLKHEEPKN